MLYDVRWDKRTYDPNSLEDFIAWLQTKNPAERYDISIARECCLGQFLAACGVQDVVNRSLEEFEDNRLFGYIAGRKNMFEVTFGDALVRALLVQFLTEGTKWTDLPSTKSPISALAA